jgi:hypothetical protein
MKPFRHRKTIRNTIIPPNGTTSFTNKGIYSGTGLGAVRASAGTSQAGMFVDKSVDGLVDKFVGCVLINCGKPSLHAKIEY